MSLSLLPDRCDEEQQYRVLSFFFDGVPLPPSMQEVVIPDSSLVDTSSVAQNRVPVRPPEPVIFVHKPFQERRCNDCHQGDFGQSLIEPRIDLVCQHCHEEFRQMPVFIHGPVAVGQCTRCHSPHTAKNEHLLIKPGNEVCTQCHENIDRIQVEDHQNMEVECFACHNPHFSNTNRFFVRADSLQP